MSLDVYLTYPEHTTSGSGVFIRENGSIREITRAEWDEKFPNREPVVIETEHESVFSQNITHNLGRMASAANLYDVLWRPDEHGIETADQLIQPLTNGLTLLKSDPNKFRAFNPSNGWGSYEGLVEFVEVYLEACKKYPMASVRVSR